MFSPAPYGAVPCDDLREELRLATLQRDADVDAPKPGKVRSFSGSLVLGLPPLRLDTLTGHEADVARSKGLGSATRSIAGATLRPKGNRRLKRRETL